MGSLPNDKAGPGRLDAIDVLRGLVMVIMALDHTRAYFLHFPFFDVVDVDVGHTTPAVFFTRWITHYCAPTFVFLAGTGAFLYGAHGKTRSQLAWFLLTRGLWLVFLEMIFIHWAWSFEFDYRGVGAGVLWAIGWSMVLLAGLVYLPTSAVATVGIALIAFHNLFDNKTAEAMHLPDWLWSILHHANEVKLPASIFAPEWLPERLRVASFGTGYAVLPWLGVMAAGYGLGAMFLLDQQTRRRQLFGLGLALTVVFVLLRYSNVYGDQIPRGEHPPSGIPGPWSVQEDVGSSVMSFLNCQKYPPSLLFILMTLGPAIMALAWFDRPAGFVERFFIVFGRVPLFFYLLHLPLIHGLAVLVNYERFGAKPVNPMVTGFALPYLYAFWIGIVLFLFPICWWYAGVKRRHKEGWLSYL